MRCEESLKIDLHILFIVKRAAWETKTVLGPWSIKHLVFIKHLEVCDSAFGKLNY